MIRVFGGRVAQMDSHLLWHQTVRASSMKKRPVAWIIGIMAIVLLAGGSAFGQFLVQPMKMVVQASPGRRVPYKLIVENLNLNSTETVDFRIVDVTQNRDGVWTAIEPDVEVTEGPDGARWATVGPQNAIFRVDLSKLRSCQRWLRLERDSLELRPAGRVPVTLYAEIPSGTRGYYCAAIVARTLIGLEETEGYSSAVLLEFLIPVIIEVEGRPARHKIELTDAGLEFQPQDANHPTAATYVTLDIKNEGGTYSFLKSYARVWGEWGGHWRKITDAEFEDSSMIPGVDFHLKADVGRALPSGKYKVQGYLFVDGMPADQIAEEFEFEGDQRVAAAQADAALDLDPRELFIDTVPGQTRGTAITIMNASEETVIVDVELALPSHMPGAVLDQLRGDEFGCTAWLEVSPPQLKLRGRARQNLRVVSRMPKGGATLPNYYAMVKLHARYPDGSEAGTEEARVCVRNRKAADTSPQIAGTRLTTAEAAPGRYLVTAEFLNMGKTHVLPGCRAVLTTFPGNALAREFQLSSESYRQRGNMLPLEKRSFTGVLDVSTMAPGTYRLTAILKHDKGGTATERQTAVDVIREGQQRAIRVRNLSELGGPTKIAL